MKYELIQLREQGSGAIVNTSSLDGRVGIIPIHDAFARNERETEGDSP